MPKTVTVPDRVRHIVAELSGRFAHEIQDDTSFESLGLDSLDAVEFVIDIERAFDIDVPDDDCFPWSEKFDTVTQVTAYLRQRGVGE